MRSELISVLSFGFAFVRKTTSNCTKSDCTTCSENMTESMLNVSGCGNVGIPRVKKAVASGTKLQL